VLEPDLDQMADRLETAVGPRGLRLSGGQVQRTAAARMLAADAQLLVVDDVSSALDLRTERLLWNRVLSHVEGGPDHEAAGPPTCLVVSHRRRSYAVRTTFWYSRRAVWRLRGHLRNSWPPPPKCKLSGAKPPRKPKNSTAARDGSLLYVEGSVTGIRLGTFSIRQRWERR